MTKRLDVTPRQSRQLSVNICMWDRTEEGGGGVSPLSFPRLGHNSLKPENKSIRFIAMTATLPGLTKHEEENVK